MLLNDRQKQELNEALISYLEVTLPSETSLLALLKEKLLVETIPSTAQGLLERKWTSVLRLQKKVMDLEERLRQVPVEENTTDKLPLPIWPPIPLNATFIAAHKQTVHCVLFHNSWLLSASEDSFIKAFDTLLGTQPNQWECSRMFRGHTRAVLDLISLDQDHFASASADATIKIWSIEKSNCTKTLFGHDHTVSGLCLFAEDRLLSVSRDGTLRLFDWRTGACLAVHRSSFWWRSVSRLNEQQLIVVGSNLGDDSFSSQSIQCFDISPNFKSVAEWTEMTQVMEHVQVLGKNALLSQKWNLSSDSCFFVVASRDHSLVLFSHLHPVSLLILQGHENWVRHVQWVVTNTSVSLISCSDDKTIRIWDVLQGRCARVIQGARSFLCSLALQTSTVNAVGKYGVCGCVDGTLMIWLTRNA